MLEKHIDHFIYLSVCVCVHTLILNIQNIFIVMLLKFKYINLDIIFFFILN